MCDHFDCFEDGDMLCDRNGQIRWLKGGECLSCPYYTANEAKEVEVWMPRIV